MSFGPASSETLMQRLHYAFCVITGAAYRYAQTQRKLFMLYRTENQFLTAFSNFKHGYIKKFYWSSHIFHWSSHFFISRGLRTGKFRVVCTKYNPGTGTRSRTRQNFELVHINGPKFWAAKSRVRLAEVTENAGRTCRKLSVIKRFFTSRE